MLPPFRIKSQGLLVYDGNKSIFIYLHHGPALDVFFRNFRFREFRKLTYFEFRKYFGNVQAFRTRPDSRKLVPTLIFTKNLQKLGSERVGIGISEIFR
jgi:hypothetical protein